MSTGSSAAHWVRAAEQTGPIIGRPKPRCTRRMWQVREPFYLPDQSPASLALTRPLVVEDVICPIVVLWQGVEGGHRRQPVSAGGAVKLADDGRSGTSEGADPVLKPVHPCVNQVVKVFGCLSCLRPRFSSVFSSCFWSTPTTPSRSR